MKCDMVQLQGVTQMMYCKAVTARELALKADVSLSSIYRARWRKSLHLPVADKILKALNELPTVTEPKKNFLPQNEHAESIKPPYKNYMAYFNDDADPDTVQTMPGARVHRIPCHKTEDEVNRQWEYNKMMGHGGC